MIEKRDEKFKEQAALTILFLTHNRERYNFLN